MVWFNLRNEATKDSKRFQTGHHKVKNVLSKKILFEGLSSAIIEERFEHFKLTIMKQVFSLMTLSVVLLACNQEAELSSIDPVNWEKRRVQEIVLDSAIQGTTYLPVYSHVYSESESKIHNLAVTVSMRNTSRTDTIYLSNAQYYNTAGEMIRSYFDHLIYVAPMETVEIVIDQVDEEGGSGANFMFDWTTAPDTNEPFFEAVMISTLSTQGLSFTSTGIRVK